MSVYKNISAAAKRFEKILKYLACSIFTACLETAAGWLFMNRLPYGIVAANTAAILIGAVVHYLITLFVVFEKRNNAKSFLVYMISFALGLLLQDGVIWLFYEMILGDAPEFVKYVISKGLSLAVPFFLLYYIRARLNQMITGYDLK